MSYFFSFCQNNHFNGGTLISLLLKALGDGCKLLVTGQKFSKALAWVASLPFGDAKIDAGY